MYIIITSDWLNIDSLQYASLPITFLAYSSGTNILFSIHDQSVLYMYTAKLQQTINTCVIADLVQHKAPHLQFLVSATDECLAFTSKHSVYYQGLPCRDHPEKNGRTYIANDLRFGRS